MSDLDKKPSRRGISKCPEPLAELLDNINLLPKSDSEFGHFQSQLIELVVAAERHIKNRPDKIADHRKWYDGQMAKLGPKGLCKALHERILQGEKLFGPELLIEELDAWNRDKEGLSAIIEGYKNRTDFLNPDFSIHQLFKISAFSRTPFEVYFRFNDDSTLKPDALQVIELLIDHQVEIKRLGVCPKCEKFYYAKKTIHQSCGNPVCAQAVCRPSKKKLKTGKKVKTYGR